MRRWMVLASLSIIMLLGTMCLPEPVPTATPEEWAAYQAEAQMQETQGQGLAQAVEGVGVVVGPWTGGLSILIASALGGLIRVLTKRGTEKRILRELRALSREGRGSGELVLARPRGDKLTAFTRKLFYMEDTA